MDVRVRMVLLGLVLGVIVAVIVAAQGCGENHPKRRTFHGSAPVAVSPSAAASAARAHA